MIRDINQNLYILKDNQVEMNHRYINKTFYSKNNLKELLQKDLFSKDDVLHKGHIPFYYILIPFR